MQIVETIDIKNGRAIYEATADSGMELSPIIAQTVLQNIVMHMRLFNQYKTPPKVIDSNTTVFTL